MPDKIPYIIFADIESLIKKRWMCKQSRKIFVPCGYSMSTIWAFDHIENKHTLYCEEDCMKKFSDFLRKHTKNITAFEKKTMIPLMKAELKSHQDAKACYICGKRILENLDKCKNYQKLRNHWHYTGKYRGAAHGICNLKFNVSNETLAVFRNGSNYDYHFMIKELLKEFEEHFKCLGKKNRKIKIFFCSNRKKVTKIDKNSNESVVTIS